MTNEQIDGSEQVYQDQSLSNRLLTELQQNYLAILAQSASE
jgi:hypothetical protein